jgi:hypothetical protein
MFVDQFVVMVLLFIKQKSACANDRRNNAHYCHVTLLTRCPESLKTKLHCLEISPRGGTTRLVPLSVTCICVTASLVLPPPQVNRRL